jgi:hypothetical protein
MVSRTDVRWLQEMQLSIEQQQEDASGVSEENRRLIARARRHVARIDALRAEGRRFSVGHGVIRFLDGTIEHLDA